MAMWNRVSLNAATKSSEQNVSKPFEKPKNTKSDYVTVRYHKLVERVVLLERNLNKAQNSARFESQLSRVEEKMQQNYHKAQVADAKVEELIKNTERVNKECEEVMKKYRSKLYDLEERTDDIMRGVSEMRDEMKELYKKTVNATFDSCMIYHNLKNTTYEKNDTSLTFDQKLQFVRDNCM